MAESSEGRTSYSESISSSRHGDAGHQRPETFNLADFPPLHRAAAQGDLETGMSVI
jgi:hypothetical protein